MNRIERIKSEIDVWENAAVVYANALEEAKKYGDYGGQQYNEHMIEHCRKKAEMLEAELQELKTA